MKNPWLMMPARLLPTSIPKPNLAFFTFPTKKKTDGLNDELELTWRGSHYHSTKAVFSSEIFGGNISVALSLLFGKIYPTMN
jgi:hypothetical protein